MKNTARTVSLLGQTATTGAQRRSDHVTDRADPDRPRLGLDAFREAPGSLARWLASESKDAREWLRRGDALIAEGAWEGALAAFRRATELEPQSIDALMRKAAAYETVAQATAAGGPAKSALKTYMRVTELEPRNARAWLRQGVLLESLSHSRRALEAYTKVVELDPRNREAWSRRISILEELGEAGEATVARADPRNPDSEGADSQSGKRSAEQAATEAATRRHTHLLGLAPTWSRRIARREQRA
jgi:tetratricopeptide (TPR) repeat protein